MPFRQLPATIGKFFFRRLDLSLKVLDRVLILLLSFTQFFLSLRHDRLQTVAARLFGKGFNLVLSRGYVLKVIFRKCILRPCAFNGHVNGRKIRKGKRIFHGEEKGVDLSTVQGACFFERIQIKRRIDRADNRDGIDLQKIGQVIVRA